MTRHDGEISNVRDNAAATGSDKCLVCNRPRSEHINGQLCTRWVKP